MKKEHAQAMAISLMREHGVGHLEFEFSKSKTTLGRCHFMNGKPFKIDLSDHWVRHLQEDEIRDTIMHEIAHAIAGVEAGHGPRWAAVASRLGATPRATGKVGNEIFKEVKSNISKYRASCGKCNTEYFFDRMTVAWRTGRRRCGRCRGALELNTLY